MANFEATVAESLKAASGPSAKKSKVDVARLPERAVGLAGDGKRDGENRLVRHENKGEVWSWSAAAREWQLIGHSADGDDDATADGGDDDKIVDGQRYDFVFNVDIEAEHPLRLGFNVGQDPWMVRATRGRRRARMPSTFHTHTHIYAHAHMHTRTLCCRSLSNSFGATSSIRACYKRLPTSSSRMPAAPLPSCRRRATSTR